MQSRRLRGAAAGIEALCPDIRKLVPKCLLAGEFAIDLPIMKLAVAGGQPPPGGARGMLVLSLPFGPPGRRKRAGGGRPAPRENGGQIPWGRGGVFRLGGGAG